MSTDLHNNRVWRAAETPAANGHASAAAIATIHGELARGKLLSEAVLEDARTCQAEGEDAILSLVTKVAYGFILAPDNEPCGPNPKAFNYAGAGGSLEHCDSEAKIGIGKS